MAKVTYSSLVDDISGTLGGSVFKRTKGRSILLRRRAPSNPQTARQQLIRGRLSDLSGDWYSLTAAQQELWNKYGSLVRSNISGYNAYIMLNMQLLGSDYSTLVQISNPPPTPSRPSAVHGGSVSVVNSTTTDVFWSSPSSYSTFVQVYLSTEPGYSFAGKEKWRLLITVPSALGCYQYVHTYPSGTQMVYRVRTIDTYGLVSPYSNRLG